jgi:dihydrofolate synthase/folylpolyglutamate synthase
MHLTNLAEAERALEAYWPSQVSKHQNNLDPVRKLLRAAGNPQNTLRVVHVAGTSGKTSTAYYVAALLKAAGKKVGLAVSPHVDNLNERVQLDLSPLPEAEFCAELGKYLELVKQTGVVLNHFELLYAFAYLQFARLGVDYAVVEVGVGGLLDATNTVDRDDKVCVITDIGR